ncbi:MAG: putative sulfate exporter family transporter [Desulfobacteraceae bacterium]|nr:MAG: putative sulfate exporter family transporter [Desulfobacteraceae bacterium]
MSSLSNPPSDKTEVVIDHGKGSISDLWKKEDYWAIWLGLFILALGLLIFVSNPPANMDENFAKYNGIMAQEAKQAPFKTLAWHQASMAKRRIRATGESYAKQFQKLFAAPSSWTGNPIDSLYRGKSETDAMNAKGMPAFEKAKAAEAAALANAKTAEKSAADAGFKEQALNEKAKTQIDQWLKANDGLSKAKAKTANSPYNRIPYLIGLSIILAIFFGIGMSVMGKPFGAFVKGFFFVFFLAVLAYMAEKQRTVGHYGFGFPLWAIVFGMLISNTIGTPKWVMPAVQTEYYIKTGLVLLGAEILFGKMLAIGVPGIFVAWVVTPIVLICTYWFGQRVLNFPSKTLNITISADMSVCGVSAAIATAAACRAKKEELTLAVGLSMVFTAVMMVAMPTFIRAIGMNQILGGAWMGGTIDATGAVAAAGAFLGEKALYVAATVKMIQNILIGVIAFGVAVYWCARVDCTPGQQVSWMEVWYRFPKFVLGFIAASIVFSIIDSAMGKDLSGAVLDYGVLRAFSKLLREWFFALAFTSIGLATNFRELAKYFKGGKPLILYVTGQSFNLILTLLMAYIMFFIVFPEITAKI